MNSPKFQPIDSNLSSMRSGSHQLISEPFPASYFISGDPPVIVNAAGDQIQIRAPSPASRSQDLKSRSRIHRCCEHRHWSSPPPPPWPPPRLPLPPPSAEPVPKKKLNLPRMLDPDAEVIAPFPKTLQLHRRGHNLPWKLQQRTVTEVKKRVYVRPEPGCVYHDPSRALGDLTRIKKHCCRKHGGNGRLEPVIPDLQTLNQLSRDLDSLEVKVPLQEEARVSSSDTVRIEEQQEEDDWESTADRAIPGEALLSSQQEVVSRTSNVNQSCSSKDLEPLFPRPKTSARTAQRLIAQGMGIKFTNFCSNELRKQEEARKNRIQSCHIMKDEAWGSDNP